MLNSFKSNGSAIYTNAFYLKLYQTQVMVLWMHKKYIVQHFKAENWLWKTNCMVINVSLWQIKPNRFLKASVYETVYKNWAWALDVHSSTTLGHSMDQCSTCLPISHSFFQHCCLLPSKSNHSPHRGVGGGKGIP